MGEAAALLARLPEGLRRLAALLPQVSLGRAVGRPQRRAVAFAAARLWQVEQRLQTLRALERARRVGRPIRLLRH